jgi:formylglycine-generating enzyme required for sulfatase activity
MALAHRIAAACLVLGAALGCEPPLAEVVTPGRGWPDLAEPPLGRRDGRRDAALIIAIEDPALGGRPGAFAVASGWWRYLVETRGLRKTRVTLLRDEHASAAAIDRAIERLEERAGTGSVLWLVFIGSAISPASSGDGALLAGDGERLPFAEVRRALSAGFHESAFMLVDACADAPPPGFVAGVPATADPDAPQHFRAVEPPKTRTYYLRRSSGSSSGLAAAAAGVHERVESDLRRVSGTPRNVFIVSSGVGERCGSTLAGRPWPALAYASLGALQGWADVDEDGQVAAAELAVYAQSVLAGLDEDASADDASLPRVEAAGANLALAELTEVRSRARAAPALEPAALSQTTTALEQAEELIELEVEDMVAVPAGRFTMGCQRRRDESCEADERPARKIELGGFFIDRHELRWREYRACIEAGVCPPLHLDSCWTWDGEAFVRGAELPAELFSDEHPVMCVNWVEAQIYCEAVGKRLPTEAEWERAARGTDGRRYPWGDEAPSCNRAVRHGCSDFSLAVGGRPAGASPVGALDMAGNVAEWVHDWWAERTYSRLDRVDPHGPTAGEVRVVRGGSFYDGESDLRSSYRYAIEPLARLSTVGFRCAR